MKIKPSSGNIDKFVEFY